jgi:hypothetical protein
MQWVIMTLQSQYSPLKNYLKVMVDDVEADEEGIVDVVLDDNAIRQVPRPGTSLRSAVTSSGGPTQAYRPTTQSGITYFFSDNLTTE